MKFLAVLSIIFLFCSNYHKEHLDGTIPLYNLEKVDSIKILKYSKGDDLNYSFWKDDKVIYLSKDSACLVITDTGCNTIKRIDFLSDFQRADINLHPYMMNYGILNDSTIVCYYESRWPYDDKKIFLVNTLSGKVSYPFIIKHKGLVSSSDINYSDFNIAQKNKKTWLAVNKSNIFITKDTMAFLPVFTGDIYEANPEDLRSNLNGIFVFTTKFLSKTIPDLNINFSQLNSVFKDSIIQSDNLFSISNPQISLLDSTGFYINYSGSNKITYYHFLNQSLKDYNIEFPESTNLKFFVNSQSKLKSDIILFQGLQTAPSNSLYLRAIQIPSELNPESPNIGSQFRYLLYNEHFKLTGLFRENLFHYNLRGIIGQRYIGIDQRNTNSDEQYFHLYLYNLKKCEQSISKDSLLFYKYAKSISPIKTYLENFESSINNIDTIPVLLISNQFPKSRHQIGVYLQELVNKKIPSHQFILVSKKSSSWLEFKNDYNLQNISNFYTDNEGKFYHFKISESMGWFIKMPNGEFRYENVPENELEKLLKFITPHIRIVKGFCLPIKK